MSGAGTVNDNQSMANDLSGDTFVRAEKDGTIGTLTFDNPTKHNALDQTSWVSVQKYVDRLVADGSRVIVVTGAGDSFCAGADISEFDRVRRDAESALVYEAANDAAFAALRNCPVPVIAAISGYCLGGGFGLAAACDLRIASADSQFAVPAAKLGLAYPVEAMADIVAAVGAQMAKRMLFTAERLNAKAMFEAGFLSEIVTDGIVLDRAIVLAQTICELASLTHRATKASVAAALGGDGNLAVELGAATFQSHDYAEGRLAFREKRKARFVGR